MSSSAAKLSELDIDLDIINDFVTETRTLIKEMRLITDELEAGLDRFVENFKELGIRVDRVMGASKTIYTFCPSLEDLNILGLICQHSKLACYKLAEAKLGPAHQVAVSLISEVIDAIEMAIQNLEKRELRPALAHLNDSLVGRLNWLLSKINKS